MSQRLTMYTSPLPIHPHTGQTAIGVLPSGRIVWPIAGAAEGDGTDDKKDDTGSAGTGDGNTGNAGGDSGSSGGDQGGDKQPASITREEYEALHKRMTAADQRASKAEQDLRALTDKEKSELEKAQRDLQETAAERDQLRETVKTQAVRLAFLTSASDITWHDPEDALAMAMRDLKDIEVAEDGTVDRNRVKAAAQSLAKSKPYLVKSQDGAGSGEGSAANEGKNGAGTGKSGDDMNGSGKANKELLDREAMAKKFPALRR